MERIGIAASKMAKGNLLLYNSFVILISFLFSLSIFIIAGSTVVLALIIIAYVTNGAMPLESDSQWYSVLIVCMISLTVVVSLFSLFAISRNIKFSKTN